MTHRATSLVEGRSTRPTTQHWSPPNPLVPVLNIDDVATTAIVQKPSKNPSPHIQGPVSVHEPHSIAQITTDPSHTIPDNPPGTPGEGSQPVDERPTVASSDDRRHGSSWGKSGGQHWSFTLPSMSTSWPTATVHDRQSPPTPS